MPEMHLRQPGVCMYIHIYIYIYIYIYFDLLSKQTR